MTYVNFFLCVVEDGPASGFSRKSDVYSFGIMVLEVVTRKKPTDVRFSGRLSLRNWVRRHYPEEIERVVDPVLMLKASSSKFEDEKTKSQYAFKKLIEIGIHCTEELPSMRPTIREVVLDLSHLKEYIIS